MSTARGGLKAIAPVPTAADFLDIVLSKTQRKTPTQIHKGFKISRIRSFYMRKVKFTQEAFDERLSQMLSEFPILDNLHPFLASLLNVLYDKNHYKLALGQINTCKHLIDSVGKDYVRLLKFGDSLYRCKQLKKAALGRMATIMRRQKEPLAYLEQVRQHMSRLPTIDPTTRTLLICGYPNVGKSSFINKITRADVDVQPYAFTTKSLFVGHMDYRYLRWQVVDTPGILDHPLEEMNTIEMQSITALAHLRACILYFMDLSEQCGYTLEAQIKLFQSIKPLFANKPVFVAINKIDVMRPEELEASQAALLQAFKDDNAHDTRVQFMQLSTMSEEGVMDVRNAACDALLTSRVESKEKTKRVDNVANRIRVAQPQTRDRVTREPFIPEAVKKRQEEAEARRKKLAELNGEEDEEGEDEVDVAPRRKLERDLEAENGGAGVYSVDLKKNYLLKNDEWKYDIAPEIGPGGKNFADFIDPDILDRLEELEAEEEKLEKEGFYDSDEYDDDEIAESEEEAIRSTATAIRAKRAQIKLNNKVRDKKQNKPIMPRTVRSDRTLDDMASDLRKAGIDPSKLEERAQMLALARGVQLKTRAGEKRKRDEGDGDMDIDGEGAGASGSAWADEPSDDEGMQVDDGTPGKKRKSITGRAVAASGKRVPTKNRATLGLKNTAQADKANKLHRFAQRGPNSLAKAGESDRHVMTKMPKHLFSGKRGRGKTSHR
ncbi:Nucleolar GTP-binding protein 1 [Cystobasidiomycetes sp. EMM_F5]